MLRMPGEGIAIRDRILGGLTSPASRIAALLLILSLLFLGVPSRHAEAATVVIDVGDFWFCDSGFQNGVCPTTVAVGDTVAWNFNTALFPHTSTDCGTGCGVGGGPFGGVWDSGTIFGGGGTFEFTFTNPGTFLYYCSIHPSAMRGQITVTTSVGGVAELPNVDLAPQQTPDSRSGPGFAFVIASGSAAVAALAVAGWYARRRWLR